MLPRKQRVTRRRRLVLVDIENLVGGAVRSPEVVNWARAQLKEVIEIGPDDQIVIGTSHIGLLPTGCAWPNQRYVVASGPDGADLALLEVFEENLAERFGDVILVSGDGIFTDAVSHLTGDGVTVTVVAHPDGLSNRLRVAATRISYLPSQYQDNASVLSDAA